MFFGIMGAITGILGVIISLFSFYHNRIEAVNAWYANARDSEFIRARRVVRGLPNEYDPRKLSAEEKDHIVFLLISYQQAGALVKRRQLPFWVFKNSGRVVYFYEKLLPYIEMRRTDEENNPKYASDYEYLCRRVKRARK